MGVQSERTDDLKEIPLSSLPLSLYSEERPHKDIVRRGPPASQEELSPEPDRAGTLILDFSLQNCKKINFCCLSPLIHGILLRSPSRLIHLFLFPFS